MEIVLAKPAAKALAKMDAKTAARITAKIEQLATAPHELANNITPLKGVEAKRLRIGDWRVIFTEDGRILAILAIAARGSVYD